MNMLIGYRKDICSINLPYVINSSTKCVLTKEEEAWLWYRQLTHTNTWQIVMVEKEELVKGLLKIQFHKDKIYNACQMDK